MRKDPNKCFMCSSRRCRERIVSEDGGYDEVACQTHKKALYKDSDDKAPGETKRFISSTGCLSRGAT